MSFDTKNSLIKTFAIDFTSEVEDRRYQGSFTIKKLGIREMGALGVRKAQLNGGMYFDSENPGRGVDEQTDSFNNMIAHLEIAIKAAPDWWNLDKLSDPQLIGKVFQEVLEFENSFLRRKSDRDADNGSGAGSSQEAVSQTNANRGTVTLVGKEVQSALEP